MILAYQVEGTGLYLTPVTNREVPGSRPVSDFGLGRDATIGDLLLVIENGAVAPTTPVGVAA